MTMDLLLRLQSRHPSLCAASFQSTEMLPVSSALSLEVHMGYLLDHRKPETATSAGWPHRTGQPQATIEMCNATSSDRKTPPGSTLPQSIGYQQKHCF